MATQETILRRPKFDLRFVTEETSFQIKYDAERPDNNFMTESVISISTKNALEDDIAAFSFVLAGDMEWDKLLKENDLVILNIDPNEYTPNDPFKKDRPQNRTVIMGLISEVRIESAYSDNAKMYRVTGQSFQKAFTNFELRSIRQAGHVSGGAFGWMDQTTDESDESMLTQQLFGKTASDVAKDLVDRFKEYMVYNFVGGSEHEENQSFDDFFKNQIIYDFNSWKDDENLMDPLPITSYEGSLNQLIKEIAAPPFLEYYFDIRPYSTGYERIEMVIRKTPFDEQDWKNLTTYLLRTRDVISENIARTDLEAYSIYNVVPGMENEDMALAHAVPWYSKDLVEKYGYKMLEVSSKFITFGSEMGDEPSEESGDEFFEQTTAAKFGKKLYEWYANNPNFYSGDITVIGHPDYRIGSRLVYINSNQHETWEFYIESVEHSYSYDEGYTTQLGVTRGLRVDDVNDHGIRFKPLSGPPVRFEGGDLGEINLKELAEYEKAQQANKGQIPGMGIDYDGAHNVTILDGNVARPANGRVTSGYGNRLHPIEKVYKMHNGIDIAGTDTDIYAFLGGTVTTATNHSTLGNYVEISHGNVGGKGNVSSLYAHMSQIGVKPGQQVMTGQRIGVQGQTGSATGVHLHFAIKVNGSYVNPNKFINIT